MAARVPPLRSFFRTHGEIRDMVVATSHDGGLTFDEPVRVSDDGCKINGLPDSGPSVAVMNGKVFLTWLTEGREQKPRLRLAFSENQGHSFSKVQDISEISLILTTLC
jgi:hypothetical protein